MLVNAIKDSCLLILKNEGSDRLTTQRIAEVAGVDIASLYQYFPNKEAIIADVFEDQIERYTDKARERIPEIDKLSRVSLEDALAVIIDMEIEQHLMLYRIDPEFYRVYQSSFDVHHRVNELTKSLDNPAWDDWFPVFLSMHKEKLRGQDVEVLGKITSLALSGVLISAIAEEPELLEQDIFRNELLILLLRYLCI